MNAPAKPLSSLVSIQRGAIVLDVDTGEPVTVLDYYLCPQGIFDPTLCCMVIVQRANGNKASATSNHFAALLGQPYVARYPSDMDNKVGSPS